MFRLRKRLRSNIRQLKSDIQDPHFSHVTQDTT
jgi:hypothetical protein